MDKSIVSRFYTHGVDAYKDVRHCYKQDEVVCWKTKLNHAMNAIIFSQT